MYEAEKNRTQYDVVSIRAGAEKAVNHIRSANQMEQKIKSTGQFVRVFADNFLRHEAGKRSYF